MNTAPSVVTIAQKCGVSPSTVCRALNGRPGISGATRARILAACAAAGYSKNLAASSLRLQVSGVVVGIVADHGHEMYLDKLVCLRQESARVGFGWQTHCYAESAQAEQLFRDALSLRPAGIVTSYAVPAELVAAARLNQVAVVAYDQMHDQLDWVMLDRENGYFSAVDYLVKTGCRQPVLLGANLDDCRGRGFARALATHNLPLAPARIVSARFGHDLYHYGYTQTHALLGQVQFDAMVCVNDAAAIGALRALAEAGVAVPGQVRVIGFDNITVASYVTPPLTTIAQPKHRMAEATLALLEERRRQPDAAAEGLTLATDLIVRASA